MKKSSWKWSVTGAAVVVVLAAALVLSGCEAPVTPPAPTPPDPPPEPPIDSEGGFAEVTDSETVMVNGEPLDVAKNEILVYLDDTIAGTDLGPIEDVIRKMGGQIVGSIDETGTLQVRIPDDVDEASAIAELEATDLVVHAGYNLKLDLFQETDVNVGALMGHAGTISIDVSEVEATATSGIQPSFDGHYWIGQIGMEQAWAITRGSTSDRATIGIVDAGLHKDEIGDPRFNDPAGVRTISEDRVTYYDGDGNETYYPVTSRSHGREVGCMAAGDAGGSTGVAQVNNILSYTFFGNTFARFPFLTNLQTAMTWAILRGADVINISAGLSMKKKSEGGDHSDYWKKFKFRQGMIKVVRLADLYDALLIFAAGNSEYKMDDDLGLTPAQKLFGAETLWREHTMVVASVDIDDDPAATSVMGDVVTIAAPGVDVGCGLPNSSSAVAVDAHHGGGAGKDFTFKGTSFAAPLVTGTAALIRSVNPSLTAPRVREIIVDSAVPNVGGNHSPRIQLHAGRALAAAVLTKESDTIPSFGRRTVANRRYDVGVPIGTLSLPSATGGNVVYYTLTPDVPGLVFDADRRTISGVPTIPGTYDLTYRVTDWVTRSGVQTDSVQFTITVQRAVPQPLRWLGTVRDQTYTVDQRITPLTLPTATGGSGSYRYGLSGVPPGMGFSLAGSTPQLYGTPTRARNQPYTLTYTATDTGDNRSLRLTFTVTVQDQYRWLGSGTVEDQTYTVDRRITPLPLPTAAGGAPPYRYSLSGVPPGMRFHSDPAPQLYGTPNRASEGNYSLVYRATDNDGSVLSLTFNVTVQGRQVEPYRWSGSVEDQTYTVDRRITPLTLPTATGGAPPYRYSVSGLPPGLRFRSDPSAPQLYGTPTRTGDYIPVYRATDSDGYGLRFAFRVTVQEAAPPDGSTFRDCASCPLMVAVPSGSYVMGSPPSETGRNSDEGPQHTVTIGYRFAVGVYEVRFDQWDACVADGGCGGHAPHDGGWGRGRRPVINVSWDDANAYVRWLSHKTGFSYRLLSESEWEYAARAGTTTRWNTGSTISASQANYGGNVGRTAVVGAYGTNAYGLYDVHGNVWEWVEDCYSSSYSGSPRDGSAYRGSNTCDRRVSRGGGWSSSEASLRSANRKWSRSDFGLNTQGFRVARDL